MTEREETQRQIRQNQLDDAVYRADRREIGVSVYRGDLDGNHWLAVPDPTVAPGVVLERPGLHEIPAALERIRTAQEGTSADDAPNEDNGSV
jgi:hypothetical protein